MSGDIKHLGCGITVLIGIAVDLALAPFKFLKTGSDPGLDELDLFRCQVETGDDIPVSGTVGIILNGDAD